VFIGDAFATAHRKHASMVGVPALFKEKAAGLLMAQEIAHYEKSLVKPKRPLCVVLGGVKVSTKIGALQHLATIADKIIIGGAMANTFLAAQGLQMGRLNCLGSWRAAIANYTCQLMLLLALVHLPRGLLVQCQPLKCRQI
jgi:3-phosphoglycerate kinase